MTTLSAAIICFNEEEKIGRCLESLQGVADEIIVVDSFSTDRTQKICLDYDVKFYKQKFLGHIEQKNYAMGLCTGDYVISLDADEVLSEELKASILKEKENFRANAYKFNRLTNYDGFWVKHCGWYPDTKLRIIKRNTASWGGMNPHDLLMPKDVNEKVVKLSGDLLHYSYDSIADHIDQTNKFTTIAAEHARAKGITSSNFKIVTRPILKFLKDYILKRGFLDGYYGLVICTINALSAFLKYSKIKELDRK